MVTYTKPQQRKKEESEQLRVRRSRVFALRVQRVQRIRAKSSACSANSPRT